MLRFNGPPTYACLRMRLGLRVLDDRLSNGQCSMTSIHFPQPTRVRPSAAPFAGRFCPGTPTQRAVFLASATSSSIIHPAPFAAQNAHIPGSPESNRAFCQWPDINYHSYEVDAGRSCSVLTFTRGAPFGIIVGISVRRGRAHDHPSCRSHGDKDANSEQTFRARRSPLPLRAPPQLQLQVLPCTGQRWQLPRSRPLATARRQRPPAALFDKSLSVLPRGKPVAGYPTPSAPFGDDCATDGWAVVTDGLPPLVREGASTRLRILPWNAVISCLTDN